MSQSDRDKWNQRYREGAYATRKHPSALLVEWLPRLESEMRPGKAVDIACGNGRNAIFLARRGWQVDAVDISEVALSALAEMASADDLRIACLQADLEGDLKRAREFLPPDRYDLAIMMRYTNLPMIAVAGSALAAGGYLLAEAHLLTDADVVGPRNPRFRVAPGALHDAATGLEIVTYREGIIADPDRRSVALAQLVARRTG